MNNFAHTYTDVTFLCVYVNERCHCCAVPCYAVSVFILPSPAVMRRRARLYPFGESVYVRLLPKLQFWLAGSNHYESPRGRLWAYDGREEPFLGFLL